MRRFWWSWLFALALVACPGPIQPIPVPVPPPTPTPVPPEPPPPPEPTPDEVAVAKWDAVTVGMTEAEVVAIVGRSAHRNIVGPGFVALGYYIRKDGASHYVEAVFGADGKVDHKTFW